MRFPSLSAGLLLAAALAPAMLVPAGPLRAQVTVHPEAVEPGAASAPQVRPRARRPEHPDRAHPDHAHPDRTHHAARPGESKPAPRKPHVAVPSAAPPAPALAAPVSAAPAHPSTPPPPAPVVAGAPGDVAPLPTGLRVTFGAGTAELNPQTDAALRSLGHDAAATVDISVSIVAYAAGGPDDPSTPRRLALARALAVRSVLMAQGIPSQRIYVRALGPAKDEPADRADVTLAGAGVPAKPATR